VLFAIPNGGKRSAIEAAIMTGEGVIPGVADLFLMFGNGEYYGFFIEMKVEKNKQTDKQKAFEKYCIRYKYKYSVCRSLDEFITEVNNYINVSKSVMNSEIN
jgi:hypothetical protein